MEGEQLDSLEKAQSVVRDLYDFNLHYFEQHGLENAARKWDDVEVKMKETIDILDSLQKEIPKVHYWSLRGRAFNILSEHSQEAEDCLSRAVKHDPSLVDTWNALGETYWKAGKIMQAHDCFLGSLGHSRNKESLRNLSMVLRQIGESPSEKETKTKESVERAKEAVALDVKDGTSWMILGNAYLSLFFMTGQDPKVLKQCISAYTHAEKDPVTANNPDLHYNRATLCQYEEDYQSMLKELQFAVTLDPAWAAPKERLSSTWNFLKNMSHLISSKGKMKAKVLSGMMQSLSNPEQFLAKLSETEVVGKKEMVLIANLKEGINDGVILVVGVAAIVPSKERVPYACILLDKTNNCVGVTIYNLAASTNLEAGKILTIPNPVLRISTVEHDGSVIELKNIQVSNPSCLLVNGKKLSADKLALSAVSVTAFS